MKKKLILITLVLIATIVIGFFIISNQNKGVLRNALVLGISNPPMFDSGDVLSFIKITIKTEDENSDELYMLYFGENTKVPVIDRSYNFYYFVEYKTEGFVEKEIKRFNRIKISERFEPVSKHCWADVAVAARKKRRNTE